MRQMEPETLDKIRLYLYQDGTASCSVAPDLMGTTFKEAWVQVEIKVLMEFGGFPGGSVVKNLPANAGDMGSILGQRRSHMPQSN